MKQYDPRAGGSNAKMLWQSVLRGLRQKHPEDFGRTNIEGLKRKLRNMTKPPAPKPKVRLGEASLGPARANRIVEEPPSPVADKETDVIGFDEDPPALEPNDTSVDDDATDDERVTATIVETVNEEEEAPPHVEPKAKDSAAAAAPLRTKRKRSDSPISDPVEQELTDAQVQLELERLRGQRAEMVYKAAVVKFISNTQGLLFAERSSHMTVEALKAVLNETTKECLETLRTAGVACGF